MNIKQKLASILFKEEKESMLNMLWMLENVLTRKQLFAYDPQVSMTERDQVGKALGKLVELGEIDQHLVDNYLRHYNDVLLSGTTGMNGMPTEDERLQSVYECRHLFVRDVVTQAIVGLWTDFGFGLHTEVGVKTEDDVAEAQVVPTTAPEVWDEFWGADRNLPVLSERKIQNLSDKTLNDGELFFAFFTNEGDGTEEIPAGATTVRTVVTEQITEFVHDPDDPDTVLYYKREWTDDDGQPQTVYYPNWMRTEDDLARATLPADAIIANDEREDTGVTMMHAAHRAIEERGWPLMSAGASWARTYRDFLQDRRAIARAVATYVDKISAKGGTRAIDVIRRSLESSLTNPEATIERNPPPVAGSTWVQNEMLDRTRMPLNTGAGDAQIDGASLLSQAGLAGGIYPHWLGRGESFRLATATSMETPTFRKFARYKLWWADVWEEMAKAVITLWERATRGVAGDFTVDVNSDAILEEDVAVTTDAVVSFYQEGLVPKREAMQVALAVLNIADPDKILEREFPENAPPKQETEEPGNGTFTQQEMAAIFKGAQRVLMRG